MSATAPAVNATAAPSRSFAVVKVLYAFLFLTIAFLLYKLMYQPQNPANGRWWWWGTIWLLFGALLFIFLFRDPGTRRLDLFIFLNLVIVVIVSAVIQGQMASSSLFRDLVRGNGLSSFLLAGYAESVFWSIAIGILVALLLTVVPLLIVAWVGAVYVLALHEHDGLSHLDGVRYLLALILGTNQPTIVVENGQALVTKGEGKLARIGGLGQLVVKQGNVVVLERGGKIHRIVNAGEVKLERGESIRNIFILTPQSNADDIEHVLTKDRIPLEINLSISVQIEPAAEVEKRPEARLAPDGEALTRILDDGLFRVYEGTIRKAALMSQALSFEQREIETCTVEICLNVLGTTWKKVAGSLPEGELRDHIMSHRFDELFELVDSAAGDAERPEVRVKKRKIYEIEQAILAGLKGGKAKALGLVIRGVDIGKIVYPEEAEPLLLNRWGAPWQREIGVIEAEGSLEARLLALQGDQQGRMLEAQSKLDIVELEARAEATAAELKAQATVIRARAKAQAKILEGQGEGEARAAFFREVLREMRREEVFEDERIVNSILDQLGKMMASEKGLDELVKIMALLERPSSKYLMFDSSGLGESGHNGKDGSE